MMDWIRARLKPAANGTGKLTTEAAITALLVEAALSDGLYANIESDVIAEILLEAFGYDPSKADGLLAEGEALSEAATGSQEFTRHVKKLPLAERISVIEALYRVIFADGEKSDVEEAYVRHVAGLLYVDDVSRAQARRRVLGR